MKKIVIIFSIIMGGTLSLNAQSTESKTLKIGDTAPNLVNIQKWIRGNPVSEFEKGKVYLVDFTWTACPGCVIIIPQLKMIADKYRGRVEVIAVYVSEKIKPEFIEKFAERMDLNYKVAMDMPDKTTNDQWGVFGYPTTFIVNQEGRIVSFGHSEQELESVLNTGTVSEDVIKEIDLLKNSQHGKFTQYFKRLSEVQKNEGYQGKIRIIDSLLPYANDDLKYDFRGLGLMMLKYDALLNLKDSLAADECLKEQMSHTPEGSWYYLVSKFLNFAPRAKGKKPLPFNYERFIEICDKAAEDSKEAFKFEARYFQALIMYRYDPERNKDAALEMLARIIKEDPDCPLDFAKEKGEIEEHYQNYIRNK